MQGNAHAFLEQPILGREAWNHSRQRDRRQPAGTNGPLKTMGFSINDEFDLSYFPEPTDQRALAALALMPEGRGLNHPAHAFLLLYRAAEVAFPNGRQPGKWIAPVGLTVAGHDIQESNVAARCPAGRHLAEWRNSDPVNNCESAAFVRRQSRWMSATIRMDVGAGFSLRVGYAQPPAEPGANAVPIGGSACDSVTLAEHRGSQLARRDPRCPANT
jgi:hypothetical protein